MGCAAPSLLTRNGQSLTLALRDSSAWGDRKLLRKRVCSWLQHFVRSISQFFRIPFA